MKFSALNVDISVTPSGLEMTNLKPRDVERPERGDRLCGKQFRFPGPGAFGGESAESLRPGACSPKVWWGRAEQGWKQHYVTTCYKVTVVLKEAQIKFPEM